MSIMKALVVSVDRYHQLQNLNICKNTAERLLETFKEQLGFETHVLSGFEISNPQTITNKIEKITSDFNKKEDVLVFYYFGRAQQLIRDGKLQTYLALPTFIPGKKTGALPLENIISALQDIENALIIIDAPIKKDIFEFAEYKKLTSLSEQQNVRLITADTDWDLEGQEAVFSSFSLCFDRSLRRSNDLNGTFYCCDIIQKVSDDLNFEGKKEQLCLYGNKSSKNIPLCCNHPNGTGLYEYVIENIYNISKGSREDGVDDLEYIYKNDDPLSSVAKERLEYLLKTEPEPSIRRVISSILFSSSLGKPSIEIIGAVSRLSKNDPRPTWCSVSEGTFLMGTNDLSYHQAAHPECLVYLPEYSISKNLITVSQYAFFIHKTGYHIPVNWTDSTWILEHSNHPVSCVSFHDACQYCNWITSYLQSNKEIEDNVIIRLPTEAEWEKAARGCSGNLYPWGNEFDSSFCNVKSSEILDTTEVGSYSPNGDSPFGCSDMIGNVREWTINLWGTAANSTHFPYPYNMSDGREAVSAPDTYRRVVRGGGYYYDDDCSNVVTRNRAFPNNTHNAGGFRVIKAKTTEN